MVSLRRVAIVFLLAACGRVTSEDGSTGSSASELRAAPEYYVGTGMATKQLALTFDDGPSTRTAELSTYLKGQGIRAVFFVNGACIQATSLPNDSCGTPTPNAPAILAQLTADGHLVANHTTTHRDITTIPAGQRVQEIAETNTAIVTHAKTPWNRSLFRAPFGFWNAEVNGTLSASTMKHYVGPIYWDIGGGPTTATQAADWECWQTPQPNLTPQQCADRYLAETRSVGKGIVLLHDSHEKTFEMVKDLVPRWKAEGYTFVRADAIALIAADFPACSTGCTSCSGAAANQCTACAAGRYLSGGACLPCSTCAAGTYRATACTATTDTVCTPCDASCSACTGPGPSACTTCADGKYAADDACHDCTTCAPGTSQTAACTASTDAVCMTCPAGTFSSAPSSTACTPCGPNTFAATAGATACTACGTCDDGDGCTTDACTPTGCAHNPIPGCTPDASSSSGTPDASTSSSGGDADVPADPVVAPDDSGCQVAAFPSRMSWLAVTPALLALALLRRRSARRDA